MSPSLSRRPDGPRPLGAPSHSGVSLTPPPPFNSRVLVVVTAHRHLHERFALFSSSAVLAEVRRWFLALVPALVSALLDLSHTEALPLSLCRRSGAPSTSGPVRPGSRHFRSLSTHRRLPGFRPRMRSGSVRNFPSASASPLSVARLSYTSACRWCIAADPNPPQDLVRIYERERTLELL